MQARLNYREPGIIEREPDALDNLTDREPKSPMIASHYNYRPDERRIMLRTIVYPN